MNNDNNPDKSQPPEFADSIDIQDGEKFLIGDKLGAVPGKGWHGLFYLDTRFLSTFALSLNDSPLKWIDSAAINYFSAAYFLTNTECKNLEAASVSLRRERWIDDDMHDQIQLENNSGRSVSLRVQLTFAADFADIFEIKSQSVSRKRCIKETAGTDKKSVRFVYSRDEFYRETRIYFSHPARLSSGQAEFEFDLAAKEKATLLLTVCCLTSNKEGPVSRGAFERSESEMQKTLQQWQSHLPELKSPNSGLRKTYHQACVDLAALRIRAPVKDYYKTLPAAGLPWYMTVLGRDTLIASYQSMIVNTNLARHAVLALAKMQGSKDDDFTDEEPGRILHEERHGELTFFGEVPYTPYYGSIDSTLLFLIVTSEIYKMTGDKSFFALIRPQIIAALDWLKRRTDLDPQGFISYKTRSTKGLRNQGWKDSSEAIQFLDGTVAQTPIALCEVQGYAYDALTRCAELFADFDEADRSAGLAREAEKLKDRFLDYFWMENKGYCATGLDGAGRQIDSITSNMGHLLWSRIVDQSQAKKIAAMLMADHMYSGWGVRTMSTKNQGFDPIGYHTGAVWPHDNSIIAAGLMRYGLVEQSQKIIEDMLAAAVAFDYRLPEAFAGFDRGKTDFPCRYPTSCRPQAWSAGAPLLLLRTLLGIECNTAAKELTVNPHLPKSILEIEMHGISAFNKTFSITARGNQGGIEELPPKS